MNDVMDTVDGWVDDGSRVALATVVDTKKSAPQPPGTKMAVNDAGKLMGAVSGGCVEGQVVQVGEGILDGAVSPSPSSCPSSRPTRAGSPTASDTRSSSRAPA